VAADYYRVLGVSRGASTDEIKRAFRAIARETHPDANPGDPSAEARFRMAAEAYEVLSDPDRRRRYDRGDTIDLGSLFGSGGLDDLINSVFGEGGLFGAQMRSPQRGGDVLVRVEVGLDEAAFGTSVPVSYATTSTCGSCAGSGAEAAGGLETCPQCGGSGSIRVARRSLFGTMMSVTTCTSCEGQGIVIANPCRECRGTGAVDDVGSVTVEIPAGITNRTRLRLTGRGQSGGRVGPPGDLFIEVSVAPDDRFERAGDDLVTRVGIGLAEATLGTRVSVPMIDGDSSDLEIPPGTQPGEVFLVARAGMTRLGRRDRGDLHVVVEVAVPESVTPEEEDLLRKWAELRGERVNRDASTH
jgi:molecular chaperone DnaJ